MLPEKFLNRMKLLLGEEYPSFEESLSLPAVRGIRINHIKCKANDTLSELPLSPLPYADYGYFLNHEAPSLGNTPAHASGKFYIQDPGAMATVASLDITEGMWVADLCAAPGGKSTQLAALIGDGGFILSNEYVPKRAKILVGNFERMGIKCGVVTSTNTGELAKLYSAVFDVVVADAPCSGEGMFRKNVPAIEEWSEDNVSLCAARQRDILNNAAGLVRGGGHLVYSTCTYSLEENERVVDEFLRCHPEFTLVPVKKSLADCTSDGIYFDGAFCKDLNLCRRLYPHRSLGEGQFIALMRKNSDDTPRFLFRDGTKPLSKEENYAVLDFFRENLTEIPEGRLAKYGENIVLISHGCPIPPHSVFSAGVLIGEKRGKLIFPSHQFVCAYGNIYKRQENITDDDAATAYLAGEEIDASFDGNGFAAVLYKGSPMGGGKASGGKIKNHYPKGLRIKRG